jgi:hypothetical protein
MAQTYEGQATPAHETHTWTMTCKTYNGDCAYVGGFPVLTEKLDVIVLRTSATNRCFV